MARFMEGDIISIPLPDGRTAVAWVIYVSERFKDCVGMIVFGVEGQMRKLPSVAWREVLGPIYTGDPALKHYGCKKIGTRPVSEKRRHMTKRRVADGVYLGDEYLGTIEEVGEQNLPGFPILGMPRVWEAITEAFPAWD